jgi:hypothetical protein
VEGTAAAQVKNESGLRMGQEDKFGRLSFYAICPAVKANRLDTDTNDPNDTPNGRLIVKT